MFQAPRLLVPTDFSPASTLAVDAAAILARQLNGRVMLLHVFDPVALTVLESSFGAPTPELLPPHVEQKIGDELERVKRDHFAGIESETALVLGSSAPESICEFAKKVGADMIVISTHGRTGLSHLLIGSVAERVVRHAPCPVLTLRSKAS
jgi:universal stress protein A